MRTLVILLTLGLLPLMAFSPATYAEKPPKMPVDVYLSLEEALAIALPTADRVELVEISLSKKEVSRVQERMRRRLFDTRFTVYRALRDARVAGYAVVTQEVGKYQPITFVVGITPDLRVKDVAVMVYRESHGGDVKRRRFLSQFVGKGLSNPLKINRGIINIAGATLSVRAITRGVRKVLAVVGECVAGDRGRRNMIWKPLDLGSAPAGGATKKSKSEVTKQARYQMGTVLEIICHGDPAKTRSAMAAAFAEVSRLEDLFSTYRRESEISRVNREAATRPVVVSADTIACVAAALEMARRTCGAFDPTLKRDGYTGVDVDSTHGTIRFLEPGLRLDLGGIAKGYALDRAAEVLEHHGVSNVVLNFGGQILALDPPPGADGWIAAVRDPRRPNEFIGGYVLARSSVSTSASYERGDHVVDPRSGVAARGTLSATVCAPSAAEADALSTALDVLGSDAAGTLVADGDGRAALVLSSEPDAMTVCRGTNAPEFVPSGGCAAPRSR